MAVQWDAVPFEYDDQQSERNREHVNLQTILHVTCLEAAFLHACVE